jgi:peptidylprolyl isomerase domain and WD repeat-containing protein 1
MSSDNQIRVFKFATGKIYRKYDESLDVYKHLQMDQASPYKMEAIDFGRRMAIETQLVRYIYAQIS